MHLREDFPGELGAAESFFKQMARLNRLGMLGTFAAVVVALFNSMAALRASRTKIRAHASINVIHHSSLQGREQPRYLVVFIRNLGIMPVHIPMGFFQWKLPLKRGRHEVLPLDYSAVDEWAPQRKYPVEIKPRGSDTFFLSNISMFRDYALKDFIGTTVLSRFRSRFISAYVFTDEGKVFKVKLGSSLRKELARLREHGTT
jgi:hypothetical protein